MRSYLQAITRNLAAHGRMLSLRHLPCARPWWLVFEYPHGLARMQTRTLSWQSHADPVYLPHWAADLLTDAASMPEAVFVQAHWTTAPNALAATCASLRAHYPDARLVFLDWYAPTDIRHPEVLPLVDLYVKKTLLKDLDAYRKGFLDTNLVGYEAALDPTITAPTRPGIPEPNLDTRVQVGWNFATHTGLVRLLHNAEAEPPRPRELFCRLPIKPDDKRWYVQMRQRCLVAARKYAAQGSIVSEEGVPYARYLEELRSSRLCFSPFGYGEICWRDFEAFACGTVVIKQDMSHLDTRPDIYRPMETYIPVAWDLSDLDDKLQWARANPRQLETIAAAARQRWLQYLANDIQGDIARVAGR